MKIELKNVKYAAFASEETNCFEAVVYVNGVKAGTARNDGHGGSTMIDPHALRDLLEAHSATLPRVTSTIKDETDPTGFFTYEPNAESVIDDLVDEWLVAKDLTVKLKKRVVFTRAGEPRIYSTRAAKSPEQLAAWLADPKTLANLNVDRVLNSMPFAEALALYKERA